MHATNLILRTDSYKLSHWLQYPDDTEDVFSYLESRTGATYPYTVFFGLQHILKEISGHRVTRVDVEQADSLARFHFNGDQFNRRGWDHIVREHDGRLPLRIRAVPEGSVIPTGNVLMTVENTDPECFWLTNALESKLLHVWYPSTVATLSRHVKELIADALDRTGGSRELLKFMLQDFGYRGATTDDAAAIGGAAHLVNFAGTDTLVALLLAIDSYEADPTTLGFSVPATEHSVMTALGREGELEQLDRMLEKYPTGVISIVADSYNIYGFTKAIIDRRDRILARDGVVVLRPDSTTRQHPTASLEVNYLLEELWKGFGGKVNKANSKVIDPHVRLLWGDGLTPRDINVILGGMTLKGFAAENIACFGMGGGLLQKVDRDTQSFAFKSSAQKRNGVWHDVRKEPLDTSKTSKGGRLELVRRPDGDYETVRRESVKLEDELVMETVFEDGKITRLTDFEAVRERAAL